MLWVGGLDLAAGRGYNSLSVGAIDWAVEEVVGVARPEIFVSKNLWNIMEIIKKQNIILLAVDAPLSITLRLRQVEKLLRKEAKTPLLPCALPGMRKLCLRGYSLKRLAEEAGTPLLLETYPAAAYKLCGSRRPIQRPLRDVVDSLVALASAISFLLGMARLYVDEDGVIVLPDCGTLRKIVEAANTSSKNIKIL